METKNLTVMFIDLVNYTKRSAVIPRKKLLELLDNYEELVEPILPEFGGKIIKKIGDCFMVVFESPTNAVLCGIKVQNSLFEYNKRASKTDQIRVKIAIDLGEVHIRKGDVFGDAVNIASRMEKRAKVDDVYFTDSVYFAMNKAEIPTVFIGAHKFKGVPRKIKIFKVLGEYSKILRKRRERKRFAKKLFYWLIFLLILFLGFNFLIFSGILSFRSIAEFFKDIYNSLF